MSQYQLTKTSGSDDAATLESLESTGQDDHSGLTW